MYRHFPTRDVLLEAVYRSEVEKLAAAERKFAAAMPPMEALRAWMLLFIDYIAAKKIIAPALNTLVESGEIRKDLDAIDLLKALIGVAYVPASPDWQQSAKRLVDILVTGSRPIK